MLGQQITKTEIETPETSELAAIFCDSKARDLSVLFVQYCKRNDLRVKRLHNILGGICRYSIFVKHNLSRVIQFVWIRRSFEGHGTVRWVLLVLHQP